MKTLLLVLAIFSTQALRAANPPLNIAIDGFTPPFIWQADNDHFYGFDIDMVNHLCRYLQRNCLFHRLLFKDLLPEVAQGKMDLAISSITITPARETLVDFSTPYLPSYARFLGVRSQKSFSLTSLNNKTIGIGKGTIYADVIATLNIIKYKLKYYNQTPDLITALQNREVDFALLDNPSALYWQAQSAGTLEVYGDKLMNSGGLGIAVNPNDPALLNQLNTALDWYHQSPTFTRDYNNYLATF